MRIYLAGKYSDDNILGCLNNIHNGIKTAAGIIKEGNEVFCPWLDYQFHFFDKTLTKQDYQRNSMAWVEVADELWVMPDSENSGGTQREIARAKELGIPIKYIAR
jgi:hypothetical protein